MTSFDDLLKDLWLSCVCKHEPAVIDKHIRAFGSAEAVYRADAAQLRKYGLGRAAAKKDTREAERIYRECTDSGIHIITIDDENYPFRLRHITCPPRILYVKGDLPDFDNLLGISIVGSRRPTEEGMKVVYSIAKDLAARGAVIVSGMAVGIDRMAHVGALHAGNKTVAVLAGGVDVVYPKVNADLYECIINNGAVVSERPPHYPAEGRLYSQRNRIIVGLCTATVIAEGRYKSGTSMSARLAEENNRDVFAIPITPIVRNSELPNSLLSDGAYIIRDARDVINEYASVSPELLSNGEALIGEPVNISMSGDEREKPRPAREKKIKAESVKKTPIETITASLGDDEQVAIVKFLHEHGSAMIDDIAEGCGINAGSLSAKLLLLEMKGIVKRGAGNIYSPVFK